VQFSVLASSIGRIGAVRELYFANQQPFKAGADEWARSSSPTPRHPAP
jgi:hypothetical protein